MAVHRAIEGRSIRPVIIEKSRGNGGRRRDSRRPLRRSNAWERLEALGAHAGKRPCVRRLPASRQPIGLHAPRLLVFGFCLSAGSGTPILGGRRSADEAFAIRAGLSRACWERGMYIPPSAYEVFFLSLAHTPRSGRSLRRCVRAKPWPRRTNSGTPDAMTAPLPRRNRPRGALHHDRPARLFSAAGVLVADRSDPLRDRDHRARSTRSVCCSRLAGRAAARRRWASAPATRSPAFCSPHHRRHRRQPDADRPRGAAKKPLRPNADSTATSSNTPGKAASS